MKENAVLKYFLALCLVTGGCQIKTKSSDRCGDGFLDPGEECDGTELSVSTCQDLGYYQQLASLTCRKDCTIDISACFGRCGDRVIQLHFGEQCDGDNPALTNNFCRSRGYYGGVHGCNDSCQLDETTCELNGYCGDLVWQDNHESCEGAELGGATCESLGYPGGTLVCGNTCRFDVSGCIGGETCGNGVVDDPEQCDGTNLNGVTCAELDGFAGGILSCGPDCRFDTSGCQPEAVCGDGLVHGNEQCDGTNLLGSTCISIGFASGVLTCGADCRFNTRDCTGTSGTCGNGRVEAGEECDDGNQSDRDGCDAQCRVETGFECSGEPSTCAPVCGDHAIAGNEVCDGPTLGGLSCQLLGYHGGSLVCHSDCMGFDETDCMAAGRCGDGEIQSMHGEICDGLNLGGLDCTSLGFEDGVLRCSPDCRDFDVGSCTMAPPTPTTVDCVPAQTEMEGTFTLQAHVWTSATDCSCTLGPGYHAAGVLNLDMISFSVSGSVDMAWLITTALPETIAIEPGSVSGIPLDETVRIGLLSHNTGVEREISFMISGNHVLQATVTCTDP